MVDIASKKIVAAILVAIAKTMVKIKILRYAFFKQKRN